MRIFRWSGAFIFPLLLASCIESSFSGNHETHKVNTPYLNPYDSIFIQNPAYIADQFDFPVGKPNAKGYYNAQKFKKNNHLGDDWNGTGGGNTDFGDPVYCIANGYIKQAQDEGPSWGNVIRIIHKMPDGSYVESLYAHCDTMLVDEGQMIKRGDKIATIGNANGIYYAHLHLEIRTRIDMELGGGYSPDTTGFVDPTWFINQRRATSKQ